MIEQKRVTGEYYLEFTTEQHDCLPSVRQLDNDLQELFAATLDKYLSDKGVETQEVHLILSNGGLDLEDIQD